MAETLTGPLPPYVQIANILREEISVGKYDEDGKLPPSRKLIERFGVTSQPVNNAIRILREEGLVTTSQRGAFLTRRAGETSRRSTAGAEAVSTGAMLDEIRAILARLEERVSALEAQQKR